MEISRNLTLLAMDHTVDELNLYQIRRYTATLEYEVTSNTFSALQSKCEAHCHDGADSSSESVEKVIEEICENGFYSILDQLLKNTKVSLTFGTTPILCVVGRFLQNTILDSRVDYAKCFALLLDYPGLTSDDINRIDDNGNCALYYAVQYQNDKFIMALLQKHAYIGFINNLNELVIETINPRVFEEYLDSCLKHKKEASGTLEYAIKLDYQGFVRMMNSNDHITSRHNDSMYILWFISSSPRLAHLTCHPLIMSLVEFKWQEMQSILWYNVLFLLMLLAMGVHLSFMHLSGEYLQAKTVYLFYGMFLFKIVSYLVLFYVTCREMFQFITSRGFLKSEYFCSIANFLELTFIVILSILLFCDLSHQNVDEIRRSMIAFEILLIAYEINSISQTLPHSRISVYVQMFHRVTKNFFKLLLVYSCNLFAFGVSFYILFRPHHVPTTTRVIFNEGNTHYHDFEHPVSGLMKIIVMFTGELDASEIEFHKHPMSYIIFLLFIFFVSFVLVNLLNGLAITDIQAIERDVVHTRIIYRIGLIERYERYLKLRPVQFVERIPGFLMNILIDMGSYVGIRKTKFTWKLQDKEINCIAIYPNNRKTIVTFGDVRNVGDGFNYKLVDGDTIQACRIILEKRFEKETLKMDKDRLEEIYLMMKFMTKDNDYVFV